MVAGLGNSYPLTTFGDSDHGAGMAARWREAV